MKKLKNIVIETPEKIRFSYHIAEIGTRVAAYIVDLLIQVAALLVIYVTASISGNNVHGGFDSDISNLTAAFLFIMAFLIHWFYFVLFEVIMEGQSPGKKIMRIRVIRENGDSLDFETIVLRNFLRVVDGFPIIPLTGGFIGLIDPRSRRLGDIVANTIVVNEIQYKLTIPDFQVQFSYRTNQPEAGNFAPVKNRLNENELYIIRRFLNEYSKLPFDKQRSVADDLAGQVRKRMGIEEEVRDSIPFLERIYKQHGS